MDIIETYSVSNNERIVVAYDPYNGSEHPLRDWDCWKGLGIRPLRWGYNLNNELWTRHTDLDSYIDELIDTDSYDTLSDALNYNGHAAVVLHLKGGSQSDWLDLLVYSENKGEYNEQQLRSMTVQLAQYFAGEVYLVATQTLVTWTSDTGQTREEWEIAPTDYIQSDCYFESGYPTEAEARWYMGLPALSEVTA